MFRFFGKAYKFLVVVLSFVLTLLVVAVFREQARSGILMFIFTSQFFFLFVALGAVYFTNGLFHVSYEYTVEKGVLIIKEVKGRYVFGKTYEKILADLPVSKAQRIGRYGNGDVDGGGGENTFFAVSGKDLFDLWFIDFFDGKADRRVVFECENKLRSILLFYGDGLIVGQNR